MAPQGSIFSYKQEIITISDKFLLENFKYKNTFFTNKKLFPSRGFIFLAYSVVVPIKSVIEAYKLVFISRILREEAEKELNKSGVIYNCCLEMNKDFTSRIFSTFVFPIEAENLKIIWKVAGKIINNSP